MMPFLFSNSSAYEWHKCRRAFYNRYLREGNGLSRPQAEEDLLFGALVHLRMPEVWAGTYTAAAREADRVQLEGDLLHDPDWEADLTPEGRIEKATEWGRLYTGMICAYERGILPFLRERYTLESAETDVARWLPEYGEQRVALIAKPDCLLHPRTDFPEQEELGPGWPLHGLGYLEFKTVARPDERWAAVFKRNPQSWTGAMTVRAARGVELDWFMVCGLVKGSETSTEAAIGRRRSTPLCWAYRCVDGAGSGRGAAFETGIKAAGAIWHWEYTNAKGWERVPTSAFPGGIVAWVEALPLEVVQQQVCLTEPVTIDWALAEEWLEGQGPMIRAVLDWQAHIHKPMDEKLYVSLRNALFPRELSQCESHRGPCPFLKVCHNPVVAEDPIGSGFYVPRKSHHPLEQLFIEQEQERLVRK